MLSWQLKDTNNFAVLHGIVMGLALTNGSHEGACHCTETENIIHFELYTFQISHILARPAAFIGTWLIVKFYANCVFLTLCGLRNSAFCMLGHTNEKQKTTATKIY